MRRDAPTISIVGDHIDSILQFLDANFRGAVSNVVIVGSEPYWGEVHVATADARAQAAVNAYVAWHELDVEVVLDEL
jgi:hypothetical protein